VSGALAGSVRPADGRAPRVRGWLRACGFALGVASATATSAPSQPTLPRTPLEVAGNTRISTSAEISAYLDALAASAPTVAHKEVLGASVQGRPLEALIIGAAHDHPSSARLKVMIVGSQHGAAEPAGGEALLVIARELIAGDLRSLREDMDVIVVPNANPDGRDLRRRANADWINLNTDFVLLSQPESRALKAALANYRPDAVLDTHESAILKRKTLAREGYLTDFDAQFEFANNVALPARLRDYAAQDVLPALVARVTAGGLPAQRYIGEITSTKQPITNGGLTLRNFRNTAAMTGALSLLVETKLDSREDTYPTYRNIAVRLERQLLCLRSFLREMHDRRGAILAEVAAAREALHREPLTLFSGYVVDQEHPKITLPLRRLDTRELVELEFRDHRRIETGDTVAYPPMLVVTQHADRLRDVLDRHGIQYWSLNQPVSAEVVADRYAPAAGIYTRVNTLQERRRTVEVDAGGLFIDMLQPNGRYAALLLDPRSTSSVFRYPDYASLVRPDEDFFVYRTFKGATRQQP
jgi:hypothetical protein